MYILYEYNVLNYYIIYMYLWSINPEISLYHYNPHVYPIVKQAPSTTHRRFFRRIPASVMSKQLRQQLTQKVGQRGCGVKAIDATDVQVLALQVLRNKETPKPAILTFIMVNNG